MQKKKKKRERCVIFSYKDSLFYSLKASQFSQALFWYQHSHLTPMHQKWTAEHWFYDLNSFSRFAFALLFVNEYLH